MENHAVLKSNSTPSVQAIRFAAQATGVDFDYLVRTAKRESSLNPNAKARSSSAAGLFQFIEQTWLSTLKAHGAKHGYGAYANAITQTSDGRFVVNDPKARAQVMGLRYDAQANALMGAELTKGHGAYLRGRIGREPTEGELYVAHFLGPQGASDLINAAHNRPTASAAALFPAAARANPTIFYQNGKALNVAAVYVQLTRGANDPIDLPPSEDAPMSRSPIQVATDAAYDHHRMMMQLLMESDSDDHNGLLGRPMLDVFGPEKAERV